MRTDRLLKLADFLEAMPEEKFDFNIIAIEKGKPMLEALAAGHTKCGTAGCAIGWMPAVWPEELYWEGAQGLDVADGKGNVNFTVATAFFEISMSDADFLFMPGVSDLVESVKPAEVAAQIREFVANGSEA